MKRALAGLAALVIWAALALQLVLIVRTMAADGHGTAAAVWRFLGFFTILTNIAAATLCTAIAFGHRSALTGPRSRLAVAAAIVLVGLAYSLLLRPTWSPTGWQAVADHALHDVSPLLFLLVWAFCDHGRLRWRDALTAALLPLGYLIYALSRGAADGWYAYWFFDPARMSLPALARNTALLLALYSLIAAALILADRTLARKLPRSDPIS